jgi:hypothetical protein
MTPTVALGIRFTWDPSQNLGTDPLSPPGVAFGDNRGRGRWLAPPEVTNGNERASRGGLCQPGWRAAAVVGGGPSTQRDSHSPDSDLTCVLPAR